MDHLPLSNIYPASYCSYIPPHLHPLPSLVSSTTFSYPTQTCVYTRTFKLYTEPSSEVHGLSFPIWANVLFAPLLVSRLMALAIWSDNLTHSLRTQLLTHFRIASGRANRENIWHQIAPMDRCSVKQPICPFPPCQASHLRMFGKFLQCITAWNRVPSLLSSNLRLVSYNCHTNIYVVVQ